MPCRVARALAALLSLAATVLLLAAGPAPAGAEDKEVVFLGFGGSHEKNLRQYAIPAFEKKLGVKVVYVTGTMAANFARVQAQKDRPEADVLWNNDLVHVIGKKMGLFDKLDPRRVQNLKDVYDVARDAEAIGVMQGFQALGLQYNTRVFKEKGWSAPASWYDLWKPEFKGRVGLYAGTNAYTQYFVPLLARLEGGNERNTDAAFRRLRDLAPAAPTFPASPAELDNLIRQGEVWIATNGSSRVYELQAAGFPTDFVSPREGAAIFANWFDVVKGAPHPLLAQELVNFLIGVEAQEAFARHVYFAPVNRQVKLDPEVARRVPYGQEQIGRMIKLDFEAMNDNVGRWTERFNKEIERR
jgi:putative spermidine/putrescine transport system substrate-binding protein